MRKIILFVCLALLVSPNAFGATDPTEATVKLYKIYLSTNADCSSPVLIFDASTSTTTEETKTNALGSYVEFDFVEGPEIGETTVAEGDYNCAIYEMSDMLTFTPLANSGASCVAGTEYDLEICSAGGGDATDMKYPTGCATIADGGACDEALGDATCGAADDVEELVWMYISTYSAVTGMAEDTDSFLPPTAPGDATRGFQLAATIDFDRDETLTFSFVAIGTVDTVPYGPLGSDVCGMEAPSFGLTSVATASVDGS